MVQKLCKKFSNVTWILSACTIIFISGISYSTSVSYNFCTVKIMLHQIFRYVSCSRSVSYNFVLLGQLKNHPCSKMYSDATDCDRVKLSLSAC